MAAPASTARSTPVGKFLEEQFATKIAFSRLPAAAFWERTVTPPAVDGGDPIDITTMFNTEWRTAAPRTLKSLMPFDVVAAYDPRFYNEAINTLINEEGSITVHHPDGSKEDFYGYLRSFTPGDNAQDGGDMPTATLNIVPTMWDPTNDVEADPVHTDVPGT